MKRVFILLTLLAAATITARAQEPKDDPRVEKLAKDLDGDGVRDSVWLDTSRSVIVCRLSSRDFVPVESLLIEPYDGNPHIVNTDSGFGFSCRVAEGENDDTNYFRYEPESKRMRLWSMGDFVGSDSSGIHRETGVDLWTGKYSAGWAYYDKQMGDWVPIHVREISMEFPATYLEDFDGHIFVDFRTRNAELYRIHTEKAKRLEFTLNDSLSVRLREITREEYDSRRAAAAHLCPEPYEVITNKDQPAWLHQYPDVPFSTPFTEKSVSGDELQKMLGGRLKFIEFPHEYEYLGKQYRHQECEVTFNDGAKLYIDGESVFVAYLPQFETLLFNTNGADTEIYLNNSEYGLMYGLNPLRGAVSPNGRWEISGTSPDDVATEGWGYYLAKWDDARKAHTFVGDLFGGERDHCAEWTWVDDDTVLCRRKPGYLDGVEAYLELTIIENTPAQ